jgi:hypothetical protein
VSLKKIPENPTFIRRLFRDVLKNVKLQMEANPNDYLRVNIDHPSLDSPIWIEFTQAKNLTEEKILNKIEAVQQSKKEFILTDGAAELDFFSCSLPRRKRRRQIQAFTPGQGEIEKEEESHRGNCEFRGFFVFTPCHRGDPSSCSET